MKINNLIKFLTFSDILIVTGWGLINPIFAVYVTQQIKGGNLELIGLASSVYYILRSVLQLPFARFIDKRKGEIDDFIVMGIGSLFICLVPFLYIFAKTNVHVIILQAFYGIGSAMALPGWLAIFTRHIDKHKEAEEWAFYSSMVGLGAALAGGLGGFFAEKFGFRLLYLIVGVICTFGASFLFFVYQDLRMAEKKNKN